MAKKGPPYCVIGKCDRQALYREWFCKKCSKKYGHAPIDPKGLTYPWVYGMKPA